MTQMELEMSGKTVVITGANKGIGYETARQLGRMGYSIWLGSRDGKRGEAAAGQLQSEGLDVRVLAIDVTNSESIVAAAALVREQDGKLDVLINNAGVIGHQSGGPSEQAVGEIREVYETNVFGAIQVTQVFLPLLKMADAANIVMVSSGLGSLGWLSDPDNQYYGVNLLAYNSSKTALNAVTVAFAKELETSGIKVNSTDPGYTATDMNGHSGPRTVEQAAAGITWLASQGSTGPTGKFYFEEDLVPW
jgi:NAD(P)-dependent dehydrogenase (short-subunit alcohol dehydrogenase family)